MGFSFPGSIGQIRIADAVDFDVDTGDSTFLVTIDRNQIAKEGTDVPDPEKVTAELADDRRIRMGLNQEMSIRLTELAIADFDTLEDQTVGGKEVFVEVESAAKTTAGDPIWTVVYLEVILDNVAHGPVNVERASYGVVIIDGMATGFRTSDIYTLTSNASA